MELSLQYSNIEIDIETFLGFQLIDWLKELSLDNFHYLMRLMLHSKKINWAMIRTLTELTKKTKAYREFLDDEGKKAFSDIIPSIAKFGLEDYLWKLSVCYYFMFGTRSLIAKHPGLIGKLPDLQRLAMYELNIAEKKYSPHLYSEALRFFKENNNSFYESINSIGAVNIANAFYNIDIPAINILLKGYSQKEMIARIIKEKELHTNPSKLSVLTGRNALIDSYLQNQSPSKINVAKLLDEAKVLKTDFLNLFLFESDLVYIGSQLKESKKGKYYPEYLENIVKALYLFLLNEAASGLIKVQKIEVNKSQILLTNYKRFKYLSEKHR